MKINREKLLNLTLQNKNTDLDSEHCRAISVLMREIPSFSFDMPLPTYFGLISLLTEESEENKHNLKTKKK